jgi:ribose 5-phosphate isomerase A
MSDIDAAKLGAARAAAALIKDGMTIGLGSGSTASLMVRQIGARVQSEGLRLVGVATSVATAEQARSLGITVRDLDETDMLDLCLDGADEVDSRFRLTKGRGGALLREKIVASAARRRVTVITAGKRVERLGTRMPIPVEVSTFGIRHTERQLQAAGAQTAIRAAADGTVYRTDGGNAIIDCRFAPIDDPEALDVRLRHIVGVFETGLFLGLCDLVVVGRPDGVETIEAHPLGSG